MTKMMFTDGFGNGKEEEVYSHYTANDPNNK